MKLTIFAKNMKSAEGRPFKVYLTRLTNKNTGEEISVRLHLKEGLPQLPECPVIIQVEKKDANLAKRSIADDTGELHTYYTLWVNKYSVSDEEYVDHSLDDYE